MRKIPSLFVRDWNGDKELVTSVVTPGSEWVTAGEGRATRKWDGTACLVRDGKLWKRYDAKGGKTPPIGWVPCQPEPDPITGHHPGWVPIGDGPDDRWHREGFERLKEQAAALMMVWPAFCDGNTYELVGPAVNTNHEGFAEHRLIVHGDTFFEPEPPRDFDGLKAWFETHAVEGIVWWRERHGPCDMVKIKRRDFGLPWPAP